MFGRKRTQSESQEAEKAPIAAPVEDDASTLPQGLDATSASGNQPESAADAADVAADFVSPTRRSSLPPKGVVKRTSPAFGSSRAGTSEPGSVDSVTPAESGGAVRRSSALGTPANRGVDASRTIVRSEYYAAARQFVFSSLNVSAALTMSREQVREEIENLISELALRDRLPITQQEQAQMTDEILNDMFGIGPIEPLLRDETVNDIMVNGPDKVFVERKGKLELTSLKFRDHAHLANVAQRIAAAVGRRVDETSPMVDARLADGSRVNVVMPPLALDGVSISIRKFARNNLSLQRLAGFGSMSPSMAKILQIAAACRLNIIISGGTGSGKTTLLNAISHFIDTTERIVTIEDAAELQLQQPHVVRLETRPANLEGANAVTQGDLVRNALRMRPDRIILGETPGAEAFDVLQAMNTGHDGSMTTLHANTPRDAVVRLESMIMMANGNLPLYAIRRQIASAVHMIVQIERMRDGVRRVTNISELMGMEGEVIVTQELFRYNFEAASFGGDIQGTFESAGVRPAFSERARYYGVENQLQEAMKG